MKPQVFLLIIIGLIVIVPMRWRNCVKLVLLLVIFEGAIRKWVFPQASQFMYFAKDIVLIVAYLKFMTAKESLRSAIEHPPALRFYLFVTTVFCVLQACNPNLGSPIVGILGVRNYLLYIPLIYLVQHLFTTQDDLDKFLRWYVLIAVPVSALALAQFFSPPGSAINTYAWGEEGPTQSIAGSAVRVTGTFSYIAGYAAYLQTCASLVVPLLITEHPPRWKWLFRVTVVSMVASMLMTGSRGPVLGFVLFVVGFFLFNRLFRQLRLYTRFIAPAIILIIALALWFTPQVDSFMSRAEHSDDIIPRIVSSFTSPYKYLQYAGALGYGTGATYQASSIVRAKLNLPPGTRIPIYYEGEPERVMLELGPVGFLLWYGMRLFLILQLWRTFTRLRYPLLRELALSAFLIHLIALPGQMVFQITFMVYYWFFAGFIFLLPQIQAIEDRKWKANEQTTASS